MVGYKMRGDNRGAPLLFCSLHRTISTSFHVPLLLPAPASPPRQGHTCMRIVCFPAKRHKRGCWGALDGVEAMSLGVLPTQSGAQLQEFCSLLTHCCRHLRASPPPPPHLFLATPQTLERGDLCVPRGCSPGGSCLLPAHLGHYHPPYSLSQGHTAPASPSSSSWGAAGSIHHPQ